MHHFRMSILRNGQLPGYDCDWLFQATRDRKPSGGKLQNPLNSIMTEINNVKRGL